MDFNEIATTVKPVISHSLAVAAGVAFGLVICEKQSTFDRLVDHKIGEASCITQYVELKAKGVCDDIRIESGRYVGKTKLIGGSLSP